MAKALGKTDAACVQDFVDMLVQLQHDCRAADLKMSGFGIEKSELDTLAENVRETMGGLFTADPCTLSREQCVAFIKNYTNKRRGGGNNEKNSFNIAFYGCCIFPFCLW